MQSTLIRLPGIVANGLRPLIMGPPPPEPWLPSQLASLRGWWEAQTLGLAEGAAISSLPSSGGLSNTLAQATVGNQPTYGFINGKGAIHLDGNDDSLAMSDKSVSNAASALTFFCLFKLDAISSDATTKYFISLSTNSSTTPVRAALALNNAASSSTYYTVVYRPTDAGIQVSVVSTALADTNTHLVIATVNYGSPKVDIWLDGTNVLNNTPAFTPGTTDASNSAGAVVGNRASLYKAWTA